MKEFKLACSKFLFTFTLVKYFLTLALVLTLFGLRAQETVNPLQTQTQLKVKELVDKKAEYNRLTGGKQDGYRIKIHFGSDRDAAEAMRIKFASRFTEYSSDKEYEQPYFVVLVGDYKTNLEAYEALKKIRPEFPNAFIVKTKIKAR
ncbi:hypothetical protein CNR22_09185 [Sphingobacteriaceae bacterium]|nr:hypothetical protein CNR22_09185 [Sphingobacteriaceae bacterium]